MQFSDLPNPEAASRLLNRLRKAFQKGTCLIKSEDCSGKSIDAHSLSVESMLRPISRNGHVYTIHSDYYNPVAPVQFKLRGIKDATTFRGFCSFHDNQLFACIDDKPFQCQPEQIFMLSFRAAALQAYGKRQALEAIPEPDELNAVHADDGIDKFARSTFIQLFNEFTAEGALAVEKLFSDLIDYREESQWRRIETTVIPFSRVPPILTSFVFTPWHDFDGVELQDMAGELSPKALFVTVLPVADGGYALLSHLDTANTAPRRLIEQIIEQKDPTSYLATMILCHSENVVFSPDWYDVVSDEDKRLFVELAIRNGDVMQVRHVSLRDSLMHFDSWFPGIPFKM